MHAALWNQDGSIVGLPTLEGEQSAAQAINSAGWIAGWAYDEYEQSHAVVWIPVPEPASMLTLLCGVGTLWGTMRARKK